MAFIINDIPSDFGHWLAGFADGEGCFQIQKNGRGARYCSFRIALRGDDCEILFEIAEKTGLGNVWVQKSPSMKAPTAVWTVSSKQDCMGLVELFSHYPLRAKKSRDFHLWSQAVKLWQDMVHASQHSTVKNNWSEFDQLGSKLRSAKRFVRGN